MGKPYASELDAFASTYEWVRQQDVVSLGHFLTRWSSDHVAVVGSGGSYSAALVVGLFRELAHHAPTSVVTPLEFDGLLRRASPRALLLSAEGKNRDILAAARAAQQADIASAALTLTEGNPLLALASESAALRPFSYRMDWIKDGYLATNSLIAMVLLVYRSLFGDADFVNSIGPLFRESRLTARRALFAGWPGLEGARRRGLLVLYGVRAKSFAVDLESKLAESALTSVQVVDLRQFAHGRHLQLAGERPPWVLVVFAAEERELARATIAHLPKTQDIWELELEGGHEQDVAVSGLLDAMFLTEAIAVQARVDPGQPEVPLFGRAIHEIDAVALLHPGGVEVGRLQLAAARKASAGDHKARVPSEKALSAASAYVERLTRARIKAIVCDFDGTLCRAENRFGRMAPQHVEQVSALIRQGMRFAIATGRGGSLHTDLRAAFAPELYASITVGYYSGSIVASLDEDFQQPDPSPEFQALLSWLEGSVYGHLCKPLSDLARGGQFCLRLGSAAQCTRLQAAIGQWLARTGRTNWRAFCSGHSVDVLDATTSKQRVVDHVAAQANLDPLTEIIRLGDSGQEGGNDYELLRNGLSLSCERVSVDLESCWNFGAAGNNQTEVTMTYLRGLLASGDAFRLSPAALLSE